MINAENVKYYDRLLSNIYNAANAQLDLREAAKISDLSEGLTWEIAKELEARDYIMNLKKSTCKGGTSIIIKNKSVVQHFLDNDGFQGEYDKAHPPKSEAEKLNEYFYKIANKGQIFPVEEEPYEEYNMRDTLILFDLLNYDKPNNRVFLSKQGRLLLISGNTVQSYIDKLNSPQSSSSTVNHYNGPVFERSTLNNSPVFDRSTVNNSPVTSTLPIISQPPLQLIVIKVSGGFLLL